MTVGTMPLDRINSSSSSQSRGVVAVVGVGPGLGFSIARRFAREGYSVVMLSRTYDKLARLLVQLMTLERTAHVSAISIDCSNRQSVQEAFESVRSIGVVEVLVYNIHAPITSMVNFTDIDAESFQQSLTLPALGAFYCAQEVLPGMLQRKKGTILFTGAAASTQGEAGSSRLACGKFALRALSQCLSREFQPQGIHVAHVILDGVVKCNRFEVPAGQQTFLEPDSVAEVYWQIHMQHPSAWTNELDLKPVGQRV